MTTRRNLRVMRAAPLLLTICFFPFPVQAQYGGGTGAPTDPYLIYTAEELNLIGTNPDDWDKHFKLMADVDLAAYTGTDFNIIGYYASYGDNQPFMGVFDGNGRSISNFTYVSPNTSYVGLFGYVADPNSQIKDLELIDPNIDGGMGSRIGSLVGRLTSGTVANCRATGSVSGRSTVGGLVGETRGKMVDCYAACSVLGNRAGGLVGYCFDGTIVNCHSSGNVGGDSEIGGLVGNNNYGTIKDCSASGEISGDRQIGGLVGYNAGGTIANCSATGDASGEQKVGGLAGESSYDATITGCSAHGDVLGTETFFGRVGGLVGLSSGTISSCYATGGVTGSVNTGGLVGQMVSNPISSCYATGNVTGTQNVGGLVGLGEATRIHNSFWDVQSSGQEVSAGGTGRATAEMQNPSTFMEAGWDFVSQPDGPSDIWAEPVGGGYPVLWWQMSTLPPLPNFSGGTGDFDDPYLISTADDLNSIGHNPRLMGAHFKLVNDIDLTGVDLFLIGDEWVPFTGIFDGNGFTISNFSFSAVNTDNVGLFRYVMGGDLEIRNLGLIDPVVDAETGNNVGSLIGTLERPDVLDLGTVEACYALGGRITGKNNVGGLIGSGTGTLTGCSSSVSVVGNSRVGGLVGTSLGQISDCRSTGSVMGGSIVGGLLGQSGSITSNCYSGNNVSGDKDIGGLAGRNSGRITACISSSSVSGAENVGGLAGLNSHRITNSYATGSASGVLVVGGLVGQNRLGTVMNCYSTSSVEGTDLIGGLIGSGRGAYSSYWDADIGELATSSGGLGKTTLEMQTATTFVGWGQDPVWVLDEGRDYPRLSWEDTPGVTIATVSSFDAVSGAGTETDPYLIGTDQELNLIGQFPYEWDKHFRLTADVNLSKYGGELFNIIGRFSFPFTGIFDGDDHTIVGFHYASADMEYVGLFGHIRRDGEVRDLSLSEPNVVAGTGHHIGSLVGYLEGKLANCNVQGGNVVGDEFVGGLVGESTHSIITGCSSSGSVVGTKDVGGLVGKNNSFVVSRQISNCSYSGSVIGDENVGGLVGNNYGTMTDCHAVTVNVEGNKTVGGLVGYNSDPITSCYATGDVAGNDEVGGLVGHNFDAITASHATTSVLGNDKVGGLVGNHDGGTVAESYAAGSVNGVTGVGGLIGVDSSFVYWSEIRECHSLASVVGQSDVGGLLGASPRGTITNCYSRGNVLGNENVGGLIGSIEWARVTYCYSAGRVTGTAKTGGLVGATAFAPQVRGSFWDTETSEQTTSADGMGKTTAEMQTTDTFLNARWDFVDERKNGAEDIWWILDGQDYPRLWWEANNN